MVTKATDPGWTPLIINCAGIVLEVGGMLQHGALVSREFNKPCIVNIKNAISKVIIPESLSVYKVIPEEKIDHRKINTFNII